jgi:ubiquinone/menaquinone biosynthesis C-methylase UbiE
MDSSRKTDDEQKALWNGVAAQSWIEAEDMLDGMFRPFEDLLVEAAAVRPRAGVLDVGCGTGSTTLAVARRLGAEGQCVGVDISAPMLDRARARAQRDGVPASFLCADAELHTFERASFDMLFSRFGVMFFNDPVRAFSNLRRAARDDAELCFITWRSPSENPFMTTAERAAAPLLPNIPARDPQAPGQFAFADPNRVHRILEDSGWADIDIGRLDVECTFAEADLARYLTRFGPIGRFLHDADQQIKDRVLATVRPAFAPFVHGASVRFGAACWKVSARSRAASSAGGLPEREP